MVCPIQIGANHPVPVTLGGPMIYGLRWVFYLLFTHFKFASCPLTKATILFITLHFSHGWKNVVFKKQSSLSSVTL